MLNISDIFYEICMISKFKEIAKMNLLSKCHLKLIKSYNYYHFKINIDDENFNKIHLYNFKNINLTLNAIMNNKLKELKNCHTLNLTDCYKITYNGII